MLLLPTFNARLNPCPVSPAEFTPHAQGNFCGQCQRVVHDFSQSTNPRTDLAAARAAAPDGRVCGRFGAAQVQPVPRLSRRLRWFVAALVLVVAQGLTAQEALAQVKAGTGGPIPAAVRSSSQPLSNIPTPISAVPDSTSDASGPTYGMMIIEQMPSFHGGGSREVVQYIQQHITWPHSKGKMILKQGRVFASFTVGTDGQVSNAKIVKSLHPLFDAEVLQVVRLLPRFEPGRREGEPVEVNFTVPITFKLK